MADVSTFLLLIGITLHFVDSQLTSSVGHSTEFSDCVVEGKPFTLTCTCVPDGTAVSQLRWFETDVSGDIIYNSNGVAGALQGDFATRAVATLDVSSSVVSTIVFDEYDSAQDVSQYMCRCLAAPDTVDATVTLSTIYNPPSSLTVTITTCEADSVVATATGFTNPGNACGEQIVFQVGGTDATTCTDVSSTCTLATSEYSVGDSISVTATQFDQTAQAQDSCTPKKKDDKDDGPSDGVIAGAVVGSIVGAAIIAGIIIAILYIMKIGCFAKKGASSTTGSRKYQKEENNESQEEKNKKLDKDKEQPKDKDVEKNQKGQKDMSKEKTNKKSDKDIESAKDKPDNKIQKGENIPKEEANKKPNKDIEQGKDKQANENQKDQKDVSKEEKNKKSNKGIEQANDKQANENKKGEGDMSKEEMNKKSDKGIEQSKDEKAPQYEKLRGVHGMKKT